MSREIETECGLCLADSGVRVKWRRGGTESEHSVVATRPTVGLPRMREPRGPPSGVFGNRDGFLRRAGSGKCRHGTDSIRFRLPSRFVRLPPRHLRRGSPNLGSLCDHRHDHGLSRSRAWPFSSRCAWSMRSTEISSSLRRTRNTSGIGRGCLALFADVSENTLRPRFSTSVKGGRRLDKRLREGQSSQCTQVGLQQVLG